MKKIFLILIFLVLAYAAKTQDLSQARQFAESIVHKDLQTHIEVLSSDSLAGRGLGHDGLIKAGNYIENCFQKLKLDSATENGYLQKFKLVQERLGDTYIRIGGRKFKHGEDFAYLGDKNMSGEEQKTLVYIDQLQNSDTTNITGKISVAAFPSSAKFKQIKLKNEIKPIFLISNKSKNENIKTFNFLANASSSEIFFPGQPPVYQEVENHAFLTSPDLMAEAFGISRQRLLKWENNPPSTQVLKKIENPEIFYKTNKTYDTISTANVLAFVKGNTKKDEVILISAHYDHLGKTDSSYYPGADDDASGVSAVLEIAEAFQIAKNEGMGPVRSLLFIAFTGEEKGLFGSSYYAEHPEVPLKSTIANLNIDMIGRTDNFYEEGTPYLYLIGSDKISGELHQISEKVNQKTMQLKFDYRYNADDDPNRFYYRSDHYNFAKYGIPVIFYFNGTHEDYHEVTDTENKINYPLLQKRARLIFYTAWELANRKDKLKIDK